MNILPVTEENFPDAAAVYTLSWRESHQGICTEEFLCRRDSAGHLRRCMDEGKRLFILTDPGPVGVVCIDDQCVSDLYVHPDKLRMGYGTALLKFALTQTVSPWLTVLSSNHGAIRLYEKYGFVPTNRQELRSGLWEVTMEREHD